MYCIQNDNTILINFHNYQNNMISGLYKLYNFTHRKKIKNTVYTFNDIVYYNKLYCIFIDKILGKLKKDPL